MRAIMLLIFVLGFIHIADAQNAPPGRKWTDDDRKHRVNLYFHLGTVLLPDGFEGALTSNWVDSWGGYLKPDNSDFKITWTAGLIERPLAKQKIHFSWSEARQIGETLIVLGEGKTKTTHVLVARVGRYPVYFTAEIKNDSDRETFLRIVESYTAERCAVCKSLNLIEESGSPRK